jgi:hypothetical protein
MAFDKHGAVLGAGGIMAAMLASAVAAISQAARCSAAFAVSMLQEAFGLAAAAFEATTTLAGNLRDAAGRAAQSALAAALQGGLHTALSGARDAAAALCQQARARVGRVLRRFSRRGAKKCQA